MADVINKDVIKDAISDALDEILTIKDKIETSDDIIPNTDDITLDDKSDELNTNTDVENPIDSPAADDITTDVDVETTVDENVDTDVDNTEVDENNVADNVTETLENQVSEPQHYEFFGLNIDAEPDGDKWKLTIKGNDEVGGETKEETVENLELPTIFGIIEDYLNNNVSDKLTGNVLDQDSENTKDEPTGEELPEEDTVEVPDDNDSEVEDVENTDIVDDENDNDEDKEDEDDSDKTSLALASLRHANSKELNAIFELGLMAKNTALEMVKDKILASTVKELVNKNKEADKKLVDVNEELKKECANYILACKKCEQYKKAVSLVSNKLVDIRDGLKSNKISKPEGILATKICIDTIDKLLVNNSLESIVASMQYFEKMTNKKPVVANKKVENRKPVMSNRRIIEKPKRPVLASKNVYNRNGIVSNVTLRHNKVTSEIDALIKDITRIGESD